jgi:hypothetical protein
MLLAYRCGARQASAQQLMQRCDRGIEHGVVNGFSGNGLSHNDPFDFRPQDRSCLMG